jgi:hypothetical protein
MLANITLNFPTDDPNAAPITIDLNTPGASLVLDMLHANLIASIPASRAPNEPYDSRPFFAKVLKDYSDDLQLHRAGEYNANQQIRKNISNYALDEMAQLIAQLAQDRTLNWSGIPELPEAFKTKLRELDGLLKAVGTPWKDIVEDFHKRTPMSDARKKELLELVCFPEELIAWEGHA